MNLQETLQLIQALKASGVTKFKSLEHDISFTGVVDKRIDTEVDAVPGAAPVLTKEEQEKNDKAVKGLKELINTMKMTPEQLADQIFPAGAGGM